MRSLVHSCGLVLVFLGALLASGAAVRSRLAFPPVPEVKPKVDWLRAEGDGYDTFFVGSSRTFRHINAQTFDERMAAAGQPVRSFNLGFDGMRPPEDSYVLETVLAGRRAPLKLVLVEANDLRTYLDAEARGTMRAAYWHDAKRLAVLARATLWMTSSDENTWIGIWGDRVSSIGTFLGHVQPGLVRALNLGRGQEWLSTFETVDESATLSTKNLGRRRDGFYDGHAPGEISKSAWKKLQARVADRLRTPAVPFFSDAESQRVLQEKRRWVEAHGGRLVLFYPPSTERERFTPDPRFGPAIPVIDLSDPQRYPELFEARYRKDEAHLNPAGAEIFTRLLVEKLVGFGM